MRKQLRCSDILYRYANISIPIKGIRGIIIEDNEHIIGSNWVITIGFVDNTAMTRRINRDTIDKVFVKELKSYVKDANKYLTEVVNGSSNKT